jgi:hypothetical protein
MRKRGLNVRLLALVLGLAALLGGGGSLVSYLHLSCTARGSLREADHAEAKGEYVQSAPAAQGKADEAIEGYRAILSTALEARPLRVRLLIRRELRQPAEHGAPDPIEPTVLLAEVPPWRMSRPGSRRRGEQDRGGSVRSSPRPWPNWG